MRMTKQRTNPSKPLRRLVFEPDAHQGMRCGINQVVDAIRPTLGPVARTVAISDVFETKPPELLDKGGLIARRITNLPERDSDMGAMYIRHMLWHLYEEVGDGTATAAVLFQAIYNGGLKYIAAGGNAMKLRNHLMQTLDLISATLNEVTQPVANVQQLTHLAESVCHDPPLAAALGDIFDVIGEHGQLDIRTSYKHQVGHQFMEGAYWKEGAAARGLLAGGDEPGYFLLPDAAILISDLEFEDVNVLVALLGGLMKVGVKSLLIMGSQFSEPVLNFLVANKRNEQFRVLAVKTPGTMPADQVATLEDIAVLTGGKPLLKAAGDTLRSITLDHLGHARRVWVDRTMFGIVSGEGSPQTVRAHQKALQIRLENATDKKVREILQARIARLAGGFATLYLGGATETEVKTRKEMAEQTARVLRHAVRGGIVPGAGVALLACQQAVSEAMTGIQDSDQRAAYRILHDALEMPLHVICQNAGYDEAAVARARLAGQGCGLDVRTGELVPVMEAGIFDVAPAIKGAVQHAVHSAALALTVDVLVHHKNPTVTYDP